MYSEADMARAKGSIRTDLCIALPILAAVIAGYVYGLKAAQRWLVFLLGALFFAIICFVWAMYFWPHVRYYCFLRDMKRGLSREIHGRLERISEETETQDGVLVRSVFVFLEEEQDERILYINVDKMQALPKIGKPLNVRCYGRHIREVEN